MPSVDEVRRIIAIENPVIRNLEITECYSRLSGAFAARGGKGANWCTYATWASKQAGRTIRGEDLVESLQRRLPEGRWLPLHGTVIYHLETIGFGLLFEETGLEDENTLRSLILQEAAGTKTPATTEGNPAPE